MPQLTFSQVEEMKRKGLSDERIAEIAQSRGYDLPREGILGSIVKTAVVKPAVRTGQAIGAGIAKLAGADDQRIGQALGKDTIANLGPLGEVKIDAVKGFGSGGEKQVAGEAIEAAATFSPLGRISKGVTALAKPLGKTASRFLGPVGSGSIAGYGMDVGLGLQEGEENPFKPGAGTAIGAAIPGGAQLVSPLLRGTATATRYGIAKISGLDPETVTTIITRPQNLTEAQRAGIDRYSLANELQDAFKSKLTELRTTGKAYQSVREGAGQVRLDRDVFQDVMERNGVKITNGKLDVSPESLPLSRGDIDALEDFYSRYGQYKELSGRAFLNVRDALDQLSKWDASKSDHLKRLSRSLRREYDALGKKQLPGLDDLDKQYAPLINDINKARKTFFDKDGNLLESAVNKIANVGNSGREITAQKLEKIYPGITQKAQIVKVMEDIERASGQKVGTYTQTALGVGGGWMAGGPVGAFAGLVLSSPAVIVPVLKTFGRVNGYKAEVINRITGKLIAGKPFTDAEMMLFRQSLRSHLENISPGDQFLDSALGKKMGNVRPGMNVEDITQRIHPEDLSFMDEMAVKLGDNSATPDELKILSEVAENYGFQLPTARTKQASVLKQIVDSLKKRSEANADEAFDDTLTEAVQTNPLKKAQGAIPPTNAPDKLLEEAKKYKSAEEFVKSRDIVFHGTTENIEGSIRPSKDGDLGAGIYLTRDKKIADNFSNLAFRSSIMEDAGDGTFININTGQRVTPPKPQTISADIAGLNIKKLNKGEYAAEIEKLREPDGRLPSNYRTLAQQKFKDEGYDGLELSGTARGENDQVVIFEESADKVQTRSQLEDIWKQANR